MRARHQVAAITVAMSLALVGCTGVPAPTSPQARDNQAGCGGAECHDDVIAVSTTAVHRDVRCATCHPGTGEEHAKDPKGALASTDWTVKACEPCHRYEVATYLYDDNAKAGPYGGSQRVPPQPKVETFPEYHTIVAGHAFTKDYNEEGAHRFMLEDHYGTKRGKFETCVQCKSTKVAYAWDSGKPLRVAQDTTITLTHTAVAAAPGVKAQPPKSVRIPAGTLVTLSTDHKTSRVDAEARFPDGTVWTSRPEPSEDATANFNMVWASTIAATKDTWPYGAGCNHCHDPHSGEPRLIRKAMLAAIEKDGGPKKSGGVNPYSEAPIKDWKKAPVKDRRSLLCAQCHVEYVCGRSGVDGIDRDFFGWSKARDLHQVYTERFGYAQDWKNLTMGEPLIKSQHPEAELYWNSVHYEAGVSCVDCHMPEVRDASNREFRSHWMTSPYKFSNEQLRRTFAKRTGVTVTPADNPCRRCHDDRTAQGISQQRAFFARQARVERLLARSVLEFGKLREAKAAGRRVDEAAYDAALEAHRKAHVLWENLAVSENSMGFHNYEEAMTSMAEAERQVRTALRKEAEALKR